MIVNNNIKTAGTFLLSCPRILIIQLTNTHMMSNYISRDILYIDNITGNLIRMFNLLSK